MGRRLTPALPRSDEDFGGAARDGFLADDDFDIAVEDDQEIHDAFDGAQTEVCATFVLFRAAVMDGVGVEA